jgi:phosphoglycolate phosphatase
MALLDDIDLIIFDKDGTLLDFDAMWGGWLDQLARRLEQLAGAPLAQPLFDALGYDALTQRAIPHGHLVVAPVSELYDLILAVLRQHGHTESLLRAAWFIPDPVKLAKPVTDLSALLTALRARGLRLAVATADDRAPTQATLVAFGIANLIETMVCADDGIPLKPAPDMILTICQRLGVTPAHTLMVGDTVADLHMGRAAQVGRVVAVLTGANTAADLIPHSDVVLPSVAHLL